MNEAVKAPYGPLVTYRRDGRTEYHFADEIAHRRIWALITEDNELDMERNIDREATQSIWREGVLAGLLKRSLAEKPLGDSVDE